MTTAISRLLILSVCLTLGAQAADIRVACVNMDKVFNEYYKTSTAQANLHETRTTYRDQAIEQQNAIKAKAQRAKELQNASEGVALSADARAQKAEEARKLENEVRQDRRDAIALNQSKLKHLMDEYMKERDAILAEIKASIRTHAQSNNYDMVIDTSGNNSNNIPTVIYHNPGLDITDVVIAAMNKGHETEKAMAQKRIDELKAAEEAETAGTE